MLSERTIELLRDICAREGTDEVRRRVSENPEEVLISLLEQIKRDLPEVSATLRLSVQYGITGFMEYLRVQATKELAKK